MSESLSEQELEELLTETADAIFSATAGYLAMLEEVHQFIAGTHSGTSAQAAERLREQGFEVGLRLTSMSLALVELGPELEVEDPLDHPACIHPLLVALAASWTLLLGIDAQEDAESTLFMGVDTFSRLLTEEARVWMQRWTPQLKESS